MNVSWLVAMAAAASIAALVAPPWVAGLIVLTCLVLARRSRATLVTTTVVALVINVAFFVVLVSDGNVLWQLGWFKVTHGALLKGIAGGLRLVAILGANTVLLDRVPPARLVASLNLPSRTKAWISALLLAITDIVSDWRRLQTVARLRTRTQGKLRLAAETIPSLLAASVRSAHARREALRMAGYDTPTWFAPLIAVAALASAGRIALVAFPNVAFTYVVVFCGGVLFGPRIAAGAGALAMLVTDFYLSGFVLQSVANVPAMALIGIAGGLLGPTNWGGAGGRVLAASIGFLATIMFSITSDSMEWLLVHELRTTPGMLQLRIQAGLVFNVVPALVNAALFAWTVPSVWRARLPLANAAWQRPVSP